MNIPVNLKQAKEQLETIRYQIAHEGRDPHDLVEAQAHHDDFLYNIRESIEAVQVKVANATDMANTADESDPELAKVIRKHIDNLRQDLDSLFARLA